MEALNAIITYIQHTWYLLGIITMLSTYVVTINTGAGRLGHFFRSKLIGNEFLRFMDDHKGCKDRTEKRLSDLESSVSDMTGRIDKINEILGKDLEALKVLWRIDDALLHHARYGNHEDQINSSMIELHDHLLGR